MTGWLAISGLYSLRCTPSSPDHKSTEGENRKRWAERDTEVSKGAQTARRREDRKNV